MFNKKILKILPPLKKMHKNLHNHVRVTYNFFIILPLRHFCQAQLQLTSPVENWVSLILDYYHPHPQYPAPATHPGMFYAG